MGEDRARDAWASVVLAIVCAWALLTSAITAAIAFDVCVEADTGCDPRFTAGALLFLALSAAGVATGIAVVRALDRGRPLRHAAALTGLMAALGAGALALPLTA